MTEKTKTIAIVMPCSDKITLTDGSVKANTGVWFEEAFLALVEAITQGFDVHLLAARDGKAYCDVDSMLDAQMLALLEVEPYRSVFAKYVHKADDDRSYFLVDTVLDSKVNPEAYAALWICGGHGVYGAGDYRSSLPLKNLIRRVFLNERPVVAVCHGPIALVNVVLPKNVPLLKDRVVTGFSDVEEEAVGLSGKVASLEQAMVAKGAIYSSGMSSEGKSPFDAHIEEDMHGFEDRASILLTGQNPASSKPLVARLFELLGKVI